MIRGPFVLFPVVWWVWSKFSSILYEVTDQGRYRQAGRQAGRETDRQTDRQTDRLTD